MPSITIIYASGSGHTEYVVSVLQQRLAESGLSDVSVLRAESASPEEFTQSDVLILGSGTWNTGSIEGQLHPDMHVLLNKTAVEVDLSKTPAAIISLGDDRYYYTCRSNEHMRRYILDHGGKELLPAMLIINEPYGQEELVHKWAEKFISNCSDL